MDIHFKGELANELGINGAILFENFVYWIRKNKANNKNLYDGEYWTYNTNEAFAKMFEFWTTRQIRTALDNLRKDGYIKVGNYNKAGYDKTLWYTFTEKGHILVEKYYFIDLKPLKTLICQKSQMELTKKSNGDDKKVKPIPDTITDTIPDIYNVIIEKWNNITELSNILKISDKRKKAILSILEEYTEDEILKVIDNVAASNFLRGLNNQSWKCSFDWILNKNNFLKILEGNYNKDAAINNKKKINIEDFIQ